MVSPYDGIATEDWLGITRKLIKRHPLSKKEIVDVVISSWESIFASRMGTKGFRIGKDIFPKPQTMGFFLHELIPLEFEARYPKEWRGERNTADKDIVCIKNDYYSIEIKTSSNPTHIYGNRSYAQDTTKGKKAKSGYYLAVNFEKFNDKNKDKRPEINLISFGWLDAEDWIGQKAETGQQSHLPPDVEKYKLVEIYRKS
jgi:hypothetical protein